MVRFEPKLFHFHVEFSEKLNDQVKLTNRTPMNFLTPYPPLLICSSSDQDRNVLPLVIGWQDHQKAKWEGENRENITVL